MYNTNKAPLSKTQLGIYVECTSFPESTLYNIPFLGRLGESICIEKLKKAIEKTVQAHPYLNVRLFLDENGNVMQQITGDDCSVEIIKLSDEEFAQRKEMLVRP